MHAFGKLQIEKAGDVPSGKDIGVRVGVVVQRIVTGEILDVHGSCARSIQTGDSYGVLERQSAVLADLDRRSLVQSLDLHGASGNTSLEQSATLVFEFLNLGK